MGRPSKYSDETVTEICERLSMGETLNAICRDAAMPSKSMVMRWLLKHESFRDQYARAREQQADVWFEQCLEIADDEAGDVNRARLRIDTRKWAAGKMQPKKYGDKVDLGASEGLRVILSTDDQKLL